MSGFSRSLHVQATPGADDPGNVVTRLTLILIASAAAAGALLTLWPGEPELGGEEAAAVATGWVGAGAPQAPRRNGGEWEVDVVRSDGSLVEVTVGQQGELLGFDEERAAGD